MSDLHFFLDCSLSFPPSNQHYSVILFFLLEKRQFDSLTEQLAVLSIPRIRLVTPLPRVDVRIHRDCVPSNTLSSFPASLSSAHQPQTSEFHSFPDCSLSFHACNRHHPIDLLYLPYPFPRVRFLVSIFAPCSGDHVLNLPVLFLYILP